MKSLPLSNDVVKMIEYDSSDLPPISGLQTIRMRFQYIKTVGINPILALHFGLSGVDMNGFLAFIGIEEKSPAQDFQYARHLVRLPVV